MNKNLKRNRNRNRRRQENEKPKQGRKEARASEDKRGLEKLFIYEEAFEVIVLVKL
jgi:hypothetical protein